MKSKLIPLLSATVILSAAMFSVALAEDGDAGNANADVRTNVRVELNAQDTNSRRNNDAEVTAQKSEDSGDGAGEVASQKDAASSDAARSGDRGEGRDNATSSKARDNREDNATSTDTDTDTENEDNLNAEEHRSTVATSVQKLLEVADREGGIGDEVRAIAQEQNDSASTSAEAITKVESRGRILTFIFGSDFKNLGTLRSESVTTKDNVEQLKGLLEKATSDASKTELSAQIKVLEDSQAKVDAFVNAHENTFSFFGWFAKMFAN